MQFISPNELLTALPPVIYERLAPHFQKVRLEAGSVLFDIGATNDYTWFIIRGIVSLLGITKNGASVEIAMAGHDSVIGLPGIVGSNETECRAQVQITGAALRVSARILQTAINKESQIYLPLLNHTRLLSKQITQAAICNQFHTIDQRLARWLLLTHDRTRASAFNITHEAMAQILGVSRSGVSSAAGELQTNGLIHYARGRITLLDSQGLEVLSCECYRILSRTINPLLPSDKFG